MPAVCSLTGPAVTITFTFSSTCGLVLLSNFVTSVTIALSFSFFSVFTSFLLMFVVSIEEGRDEGKVNEDGEEEEEVAAAVILRNGEGGREEGSDEAAII